MTIKLLQHWSQVLQEQQPEDAPVVPREGEEVGLHLRRLRKAVQTTESSRRSSGKSCGGGQS
jgi:hypothetical protein